MKSSMFHTNATPIVLLLIVGIVLFGVTATNAAPQPASYPGYYPPAIVQQEGQQNPEYVLQTIARLRQLIADDDLEKLQQQLIADDDFQNTKRGDFDFGLGRGFSGSLAAKHLRGLQAAAGGPGRKRRSDNSA